MIFYTNSGPKDFSKKETPTLNDIAISLSRECRYAGASVHWWPVALHSFVVADMLSDQIKIYGLLHDAAESVTGDIPKPAKTAETKALEDNIQEAIYLNLGIPRPTIWIKDLVHIADRECLFGEVWTVGTKSLREHYVDRNSYAESRVMNYFAQYSVMDCVIPDGKVPTEFINRFARYKEMMK